MLIRYPEGRSERWQESWTGNVGTPQLTELKGRAGRANDTPFNTFSCQRTFSDFPGSQLSAILPGAFRQCWRIMRHCALHVRRCGERIELDLNRHPAV